MRGDGQTFHQGGGTPCDSETEELSGTGVAFMAGMKLGLWDKEIFDTIKRRHVLPQMAEDVRRQKCEGYQKAVDRIRN